MFLSFAKKNLDFYYNFKIFLFFLLVKLLSLLVK
jgi:hypothetical protein